MSDKLKVTPSGCPGPIPGSRVWRCDGVNCVYGPHCFDSCKQAIADRGYVLRISSDLVEEAAEAAELHRQTAQGQLEQTRQELADEAKAHKQTAATLQKEVELTQSEADEFANLYVEQMMLQETANAEFKTEVELNGSLMRENADLRQDVDTSCEHCSELLQEIAELRDELAWYKQQFRPVSQDEPGPRGEEGAITIETTDNTGDIDTRSGAGDNGNSVLDTGVADGTVTE